MRRRGFSRRKDYAHVRFNADWASVQLQPFVDISRRLDKSARVSFSSCGGGVMKSRMNSERLFVDSYTAIKTLDCNAEFSCHIKEPGDEPDFVLRIKKPNSSISYFMFDELEMAEIQWKEVVDLAVMKQSWSSMSTSIAA